MCISLFPLSLHFMFIGWLKWNITYIVSGCQRMSFRMQCEACDIEGPRASACPDTAVEQQPVTHDATVLALGSSQCWVTR